MKYYKHMPEIIYTVDEVAKILKIKSTTMWGYVRSGKIKSFRLGNRVVIRGKDLKLFINRPPLKFKKSSFESGFDRYANDYLKKLEELQENLI